jgi:hypothetical protein
MAASRYFIGQIEEDGSADQFVIIPEMFRAEWTTWIAAGACDDIPFYARRLKSLEEVNFISPEFGK